MMISQRPTFFFSHSSNLYIATTVSVSFLSFFTLPFLFSGKLSKLEVIIRGNLMTTFLGAIFSLGTNLWCCRLD